MAAQGLRRVIPAPARHVWRLMGERHLGLIAAGVAFFAMLALFPALAALIAIVGLWADPASVEQALDLAADLLPPEVLDLIAHHARRLTAADSQTLGLASVVSLALALWSARLGVSALVQGLTAIHGGALRGSLRGTGLALLLTLMMVLVGATAITFMLLVPVAMALLGPFLPGDSLLPHLAEALRWSVSLGALVLGLGIFYRYGPNRADGRRSSFLSAGLFLALLLWGLASLGLTFFMASFGNFNEVYGSIGAVIALLMWLYLSAYAVLIGAALNHALENGTPNGTGNGAES